MEKTSSLGLKGPFADLTNDVAFKWIFGRETNKDLLMALLNELIPDRDITDITLFKESNLPYAKELKKGVFDISCKTANGEYIDVEVQVKPQDWYADRCLYYSTYNLQEQISEGAKQYSLKPVYVVSIMNFVRPHGPEWDMSRISSSYSLREDECHEKMTDSLHFVFVELPLFTKKWENLENDKERFYFCFRHLHELEEIPEGAIEGVFLKLAGQARLQAMPTKIKKNYINTMTTEIDKRAQLAYQIRIATEEGHKIGMEIGLEQGIQQGRSEGAAESARQIASKFKAMGFPIESIAQATGLSIEEIEKNL